MSASGQAVRHRVPRGLHPAGDAELAVHRGQVPFDRGRAQVQPPGDLLVGQPAGEQPEHLRLARGEAAGQRHLLAGLGEGRAGLGQPLRVGDLGGQCLRGAKLTQRALGHGTAGAVPLPGADQQVGQVGQADHQGPLLTELPLDDQGLLELLTCGVQVAVVHLQQR
jgi:hypothetical protein